MSSLCFTIFTFAYILTRLVCVLRTLFVIPVKASQMMLDIQKSEDHVQALIKGRSKNRRKNVTEGLEDSSRRLSDQFMSLSIGSNSVGRSPGTALSSKVPGSVQPRQFLSPTPSYHTSTSSGLSLPFHESTSSAYQALAVKSKSKTLQSGHVHLVAGDGNCAPRSASVLLLRDESHWPDLKAKVAEWAIDNYEFLHSQYGVIGDDILEMAKHDEWQKEAFFLVCSLCFDVTFLLYGMDDSTSPRYYPSRPDHGAEVYRVFFHKGHYSPIMIPSGDESSIKPAEKPKKKKDEENVRKRKQKKMKKQQQKSQ